MAFGSNHMAVINIAKSQLGMVEEDYRAMLVRVTGKASLRALSEPEKADVITELKRLGFRKTKSSRPAAKRRDVRYCHVLWGLLHKAGNTNIGGAKGLNAFIRARFSKAWGATPIDVDQMTDSRQIATVIEALQAWCKRAGIPTDLPRE